MGGQMADDTQNASKLIDESIGELVSSRALR
jgi:hypothetical protein